MKFLINIIVLYLVTFQMAFGQTLINTDQVEIGKKGSTAVKQLKFRTTNQKSLSADYSTEGLSYDGNSLSVGDGTASNKTLKFNKGANSPEIRFNNTTGKLEFSNDASLYKDIGSGSGGTKNYITETDGTSQGSWTTYADAAGTSPVDGTGGVPTVTYVASTDSTMRGTTNFLFTHPASNVQGNGFSYNFTIDPSDEGKVLQASLEYKVASGTFADNDLDFWIYDVTNATLIQPAPYHLKNSGVIEKFAFEFQTASNSTSYRLIGHVATATATAYTLRFTNWNVGPQAKLYGSPITDWVAYTPVITGLGSGSNEGFYWRRNGDSLEIKGVYASATTTATTLSVSLPAGLSIDASKISTTTNANSFGLAYNTTHATTGYASTNVGPYPVFSDTAVSSTVLYIADTNSGARFNKANGSTLFTTNDRLRIEVHSIPIVGWSSSQVVSSDADTRVVAAQFGGIAPSATAGNPLIFASVGQDTHSGYNVSTGQYTVKVSGFYRVSGYVDASTLASGQNVYVSVNGNTVAGINRPILAQTTGANLPVSGSGTVYALAGQTIDIRATGNTGATVASNIYIERISGPSQIMASDSVSALYTGAPPTGTINSGYNVAIFGTKVKDSHNAYNTSTGVYTVPVSGVYDISAQVDISGTYTANQQAEIAIAINGTPAYSSYQYSRTASSLELVPYIAVKSIPLLAGQTVSIQTLDNATTPSFQADARRNYFSIVRAGNY